ncbi:hypothetical protein MHK_007573 [Candidatus Magnetomorum sp. HK-1]|nr:hypothetical protein MHK_007573 [Candidatus Magnetomorum sp. HK-1]
MLKNVLANCKICDSPADCLYINNYYKILFESLISNIVAGANFDLRDKCQVLRALTKCSVNK